MNFLYENKCKLIIDTEAIIKLSCNILSTFVFIKVKIDTLVGFLCLTLGEQWETFPGPS